MVHMYVLTEALQGISNIEKQGTSQVPIIPYSEVIVWFLSVIMKHNYNGKIEIIDDYRAGKIVVNFTDR
uniref:40S ribosomal protein S15a n=1 Tax=Monodelphis domestica TaxID=13616 RepID=A0A5F8H548_MONDO